MDERSSRVGGTPTVMMSVTNLPAARAGVDHDFGQDRVRSCGRVS